MHSSKIKISRISKYLSQYSDLFLIAGLRSSLAKQIIVYKSLSPKTHLKISSLDFVIFEYRAIEQIHIYSFDFMLCTLFNSV